MKEGHMFTEFFNNGNGNKKVFSILSQKRQGNMKGPGEKAKENRDSFNSKYVPKGIKIVRAGQFHGSNVKIVSDTDKDIIESVDGLITNLSGVALETTFADCPPVFLFYQYPDEPEKKIIGNIHVGYSGFVDNILMHTIRQLKFLGGKPEKTKAGIGPGICGRCYEFSTKDTQIFGAYDNSEFIKPTADPKKCLVDLKAMIFHQLVQLGLKPENILDCNICTMESHNYFSARGRADKSQPIEANLGIIGVR